MDYQLNNFMIENTFFLSSKDDLVQSFRSKDQDKLVLPDDLKFPLRVRSYFTWKEPSGVYTYLVFKMPNWELPRGVAFKRTTSAGEPTGGIYNWCHAYGSSEEIGMMSMVLSPKVLMSYFLCQDLRCIEKIKDACELAGKSPDKQISDLYGRMEKLFERLQHEIG